MQLCSIPNCSSSLIYPILDLSYHCREWGIGTIINGWYVVCIVDGLQEVVFMPLSMGGTCSRRAVYIVNDPGLSRWGQGGHPQTSVLGLRGASPSLCGHCLLHCHHLDRFVTVGLHSPLLGLDIHCRWVSFAVVALDWLRIRLIAVEPSRRRRSHLVIILPVLGYLHQPIGCRCHCWGEHVIDGPYVLSMGIMCRCWMLRVVDEWCVLSMGHCNPPILALIPQKRGGCAFLGASIHSLCRQRLEYHSGDSPFSQVWWPWVQWLVGWKERRQRKTNHNKCCGSFLGRTLWASPWSFSAPPYSFSLPKSFIQRKRATHISMKRGGAVWLGSRIKLIRVLVVEPTSLTRGEGLMICLLCVVEREAGCWGGMVVVEEWERISQYQLWCGWCEV